MTAGPITIQGFAMTSVFFPCRRQVSGQNLESVTRILRTSLRPYRQ